MNLALIFLLGFILFSCSPSQNEKNDRFIYWSSNNQYEIEFARAVVSEWNQLYPDRPVHTQPVPEGQSSEEVILAAVVGKTTPDIYSNMWQGDVEAYAQAGAIIVLDTMPGFWEFIYNRCDSAVVEEIKSTDGHIYQLPWKINPIMQLYNEKYMKELGFDTAPLTFSEYFESARKFKKDADGDGYIDRWISYRNVEVTWWQRLFDFYTLYLAISGGGSLVKGSEVAFENEHAIQTFAFFRKMYENNYYAKERLDAREDAFLSGIIATRFTGPWEIARAERFKPEGFEYAFSPIPVPDDHQGPVYTYGDPKNIVLFNNCTNPKVAWEFLKFMLNKENDRQLLQISNQLPRRKNLFDDPFFEAYFQANPKMIPFAKQSKYVKGTDACPVLKEVFDIISQEYEACVIYGVKTPERAIEDAAQAVRLLLL